MTRKSAPKDPKPVGRPSKFTDDVKTRIVKGIKLGMSYELASQYGGISYDTFNEWRKRGEAEGEGPYYDFCRLIGGEHTKRDSRASQQIKKTKLEKWRTGAWLVPYRHSD
jgi:abortive infection bacteriophage resistance protein